MLLKYYSQYASKFGKLSLGHRTWKISFHSNPKERKGKPKNAQTTTQLHSSHMLARLCSKFIKLGFSSTWTKNFQMYDMGFEEAEVPEIKLTNSIVSWRKQESSRKKHLLPVHWLYQSHWLCGSWPTGKFLKRWECQTTLPVSWETCIKPRNNT